MRYVFLFLCILLVTGCRSSTDTTAFDSSIPVGGIFALTGVGSAIGQEELKGAMLAVKEINDTGGIDGVPLKFIVEDVSIDKLTKSVSAVKKLIDLDRVQAIVGPMWDEPAALVAPLAEDAQVPLVTHNVTKDVEVETSYAYMFGTWPDTSVGIKQLLAFAQKEQLHRISIIRPADGGFWQYTRNLFIENAPAFDIEIVADININDPLTRQFQTHLLKATKDDPDAIFMVVSDPTQCVMLKQKRELGITIPVLSTEAAGNAASLTDCPKLMEDIFFSTPMFSSRYDSFSRSFVEEYGHAPQFPSAASAYDAVYVLAEAMTKNSSGTLHERIADTDGLRGIMLEHITFDDSGFVYTPEDAYRIKTTENGSFVNVE